MSSLACTVQPSAQRGAVWDKACSYAIMLASSPPVRFALSLDWRVLIASVLGLPRIAVTHCTGGGASITSPGRLVRWWAFLACVSCAAYMRGYRRLCNTRHSGRPSPFAAIGVPCLGCKHLSVRPQAHANAVPPHTWHPCSSATLKTWHRWLQRPSSLARGAPAPLVCRRVTAAAAAAGARVLVGHAACEAPSSAPHKVDTTIATLIGVPMFRMIL